MKPRSVSRLEWCRLLGTPKLRAPSSRDFAATCQDGEVDVFYVQQKSLRASQRVFLLAKNIDQLNSKGRTRYGHISVSRCLSTAARVDLSRKTDGELYMVGTLQWEVQVQDKEHEAESVDLGLSTFLVGARSLKAGGRPRPGH